MKKCPVCEFTFPNPVPAFCPQCGWDIKNDPTIVPSLDKIPETLLDEYRQRIKIAIRIWQELDTTTAHKKELEQALGDSFRKNEELTKSKAKVVQLVERYKISETELREKSAGERSKTETAQQEVLQSRQALDELTTFKNMYQHSRSLHKALRKQLREEQAKTTAAEQLATQRQKASDAAQRRISELEQEQKRATRQLYEQESKKIGLMEKLLSFSKSMFSREFTIHIQKIVAWFVIFGLIPTLAIIFLADKNIIIKICEINHHYKDMAESIPDAFTYISDLGIIVYSLSIFLLGIVFFKFDFEGSIWTDIMVFLCTWIVPVLAILSCAPFFLKALFLLGLPILISIPIIFSLAACAIPFYYIGFDSPCRYQWFKKKFNLDE